MYDDFYQLTGRPFQLTPDPEFYFESITHRKALSYLGYGLAQGEGFIVITGEIGAGKSTLAAHLLATIDRQRLTAAQIVTSKLDGGELVHMATRAFGLEVVGNDKTTALARIEQFLQEEARAGRRCLLVVDEAQNLSVEALEELRMLSNFQLGSHPLLQIFLLGQPEFRKLLQESPALEQLRQRVIATHHLDAMEPAEVGPYVEHRLSRVGWKGNPAFDQRVYTELARASGGVPRRLNQILNRLLLMGAIEQRTRIDAAMLDEVLADIESDSASTGAAAPVQVAAPEDFIPILTPIAEDAPTHAVDPQSLHDALAARDEQIAELQQAVIELAEMRTLVPAEGAAGEDPRTDELVDAVEALTRRLGALETRVVEQDQAIRHVLGMLIEWIESENPQRAAA
jgi:putative secretion ATPase (PEP-CTERM system associated)